MPIWPIEAKYHMSFANLAQLLKQTFGLFQYATTQVSSIFPTLSFQFFQTLRSETRNATPQIIPHKEATVIGLGTLKLATPKQFPYGGFPKWGVPLKSSTLDWDPPWNKPHMGYLILWLSMIHYLSTTFSIYISWSRTMVKIPMIWKTIGWRNHWIRRNHTCSLSSSKETSQFRFIEHYLSIGLI